MSLFLHIHPDTPQQRLINQAVEALNKGKVIAYPTDSTYALGCLIGNKKGLDRIRLIRQLSDKHNFTILCRDLSELATYSQVSNSQYRLLKNHTPGAFTFILPGTREVPRQLMHPKRKTIGLRVPDHAITQALLQTLEAPLITTSLQMPREEYPLIDPYDIEQVLGNQVDVIINGGFCGIEATTVVSLLTDTPELIRAGKGDASSFT